ncbi:carboxymuconolactone decarboxylase family protein [Cohnella sp. GCM10012308]|uniref:carboxymuconolactone decarboxylase family protein n=1 Tax=Cohnella sp. GCM10012308 TaxID=3317329 RepID=UPI003612F23F
MQLRMNHQAVNPAAFQALLKLEESVKKMGLDPVLYELIKIRASQINGCAFCLDMHTTDLRKMGESERRINLVAVWHEAPQFTEKERAALALTEAVVRIADAGVPQDIYDEARRHFSESEYIAIVMAVNAISSWNRIAIATGMFPGCFDKQTTQA